MIHDETRGCKKHKNVVVFTCQYLEPLYIYRYIFKDDCVVLSTVVASAPFEHGFVVIFSLAVVAFACPLAVFVHFASFRGCPCFAWRW